MPGLLWVQVSRCLHVNLISQLLRLNEYEGGNQAVRPPLEGMSYPIPSKALMFARLSVLVLGLFLVSAASVLGQHTTERLVSGVVLDQSTDEALPGASIQIEGTYRGTITNAEGAFELRLPTDEAVLVVRFIGYASQQVSVSPSDTFLRIVLPPSSVSLPEITITGEDPAVRIMRRVIEEKTVWLAELKTYTVTAYNRFRMENDTGIVSIWESGTRAFWDRDRGMREVSLWQEQTDNVDIGEFLPAALFVANLYDDNLDIAGHNLMGVTHPDALAKYRFHLQSIESSEQVPDVFVVEVEPRSSTFSGFRGTLRIQDETFAMLSADLKPGGAFVFPPPIQNLEASYRQQFAFFGSNVWLPIDLQTQMEIRIGIDRILAFPPFRIHQMSRLSDFEVNVALPDSLFASDDLVVVDSSIARPTTRPADVIGVPLSDAELTAYATIDSTLTVEKAFEPSGALARFVRSAESESSGSSSNTGALSGSWNVLDLRLRPDFWYNRVEGFRVGMRGSIRVLGPLRASGMIGWETARSAMDVGYGIEAGKKHNLFLRYRDETATIFESALWDRLVNSADVSLGRSDYYDYHRVKAIDAGITSASVTPADLDIRAAWSREEYASLNQQLATNWLGLDMADRANPNVAPGTLERLELRLVRSLEFLEVPIGPQQRTAIRVEKGLGGTIQDRTDYWLAEADILLRLPTFFRRRLIPNALDLRVVAGRIWGRAPVQRFGTVDGSSTLTTFGDLKTGDSPPYVGDRWGMLAWEHSFRTVPFERLGWRWAVKRHWSLIVHGAHGYADSRDRLPVGYTELGGRWHHEAGLSLSGLFTLFRLDAAWRLDTPGFRVGLSSARIF